MKGYRSFVFPVFMLLFSYSFAQLPEQDCVGAISICENVYRQELPPTDYGIETEHDNSCLSRELHSQWYRLRTGADGSLCFTINPFNGTDNYDWAIYDLTGRYCGELTEAPDMLLACNASAEIACEGITGANDNPLCPDQNEACLEVGANRTLLLRVQSPVQPRAGYEIDFSASTTYLIPPADPPFIEHDEPCWGTSALIQVNPVEGGNVNWYQDRFDSVPVHTGLNFYTIPLVETATWFLETKHTVGCPFARYPLNLVPHEEVNGFIQKSDSILEFPNPVVSFALGGTIEGAYYHWDLGNGVTSSLATPAYTYEHPGTYEISLRVTDVNGCNFKFETQIEVLPLKDLYVATAFSPNEDGKNDYWFASVYLTQQFQVSVYNRLGHKVFESNQADFQWDGRDQTGQPVSPGTYLFNISYIDFVGNLQQKGGVLTLIR